ncbi:MAG: HNH endonuclease [Sedimentisphaerales bacterium]|nr:HNH endonuclease [Sedimentisphaerales bacterium]
MRIRITIQVPEEIERILVRPALWYRKRRYGFAFRRIPLTMGLYALVDPEIYYRLNKYEWTAAPSGETYYAMRIDFVKHKYAPVWMHKEILKVSKGQVVDHRNGNGLDNRGANLRGITTAQNRLNCGKHAKASSKYKGVCRVKGNEKWAANISKNKRRIFLGYYDEEIDAAKAYDKAAKRYHGVYARLNFPEKCETYEELCGIRS